MRSLFTFSRALLTLLLSLFVTALTAQITYKIGTRSFNHTDAARNNRAVFGEVYYPTPVTTIGNNPITNAPVAAGTFPVVIFGHGFVMSWNEYPSLWDSLVTKGYIVVMARTEGSFFPSHENFGKDLAFLEDLYNSPSPPLPFEGRINGKSAIIGHSMGGGCAMYATYLSHPTTAVLLDPAVLNPATLITENDNLITAPTLTFSSDDGTTDACIVNADPLTFYTNLTNAALPYKAFVKLTGAGHCSFASAVGFNCSFGNGGCGGTSADSIQTRMFALLTPWLNYYLKNDCAAYAAFYEYFDQQPPTVIAANKMHAPTQPIPTPLSISTQGNTLGAMHPLSGTAGYAYQWQLEGVPIDTATQPTYTATQNGNYTVVVTNSNNCTASATATVTGIVPTAIKNNSTEKIAVHIANVAEGIALHTIAQQESQSKLVIFDSIGRQVASYTLVLSAGEYVTTLPFEAPAGVYYAHWQAVQQAFILTFYKKN